jgi:hypothetical protein
MTPTRVLLDHPLGESPRTQQMCQGTVFRLHLLGEVKGLPGQIDPDLKSLRTGDLEPRRSGEKPVQFLKDRSQEVQRHRPGAHP